MLCNQLSSCLEITMNPMNPLQFSEEQVQLRQESLLLIPGHVSCQGTRKRNNNPS